MIKSEADWDGGKRCWGGMGSGGEAFRKQEHLQGKEARNGMSFKIAETWGMKSRI